MEVFGKTAQVVRDYCTKGKQVYLEGSIRYDEWTDKDGNKKYMTKIRVSGPNSRLVLLGSRGEGGGGGGARGGGGPPEPRSRRPSPARTSRPPTTTSRSERPTSRPPAAARVHGHPALAVERFLPPYRYEQEVVTGWVREWLEESGRRRPPRRLLSVYASAGVKARASVVPIEEVFHPGDFETQNDRYREIARAARRRPGPPRPRRPPASRPPTIDLVVSVSCTGFMIPAVDAYVADALGLGPRLARLPITESGCAGGVVGLARAADYLRRPSRPGRPRPGPGVLEPHLPALGPLGHQRRLHRDLRRRRRGRGAGGRATTRGPAGRPSPACGDAESLFFPGTTHLMGFRLRNQGLQIILDKGLAPFVRREVVGRGRGLPGARAGCARDDIARWVLHPGGRRIIEVMAERLGLAAEDLAPTEAVLAEHGNMSSVTVLFVLDEILRAHRPAAGARGLLGAFGPGFGAELALLEFA